MIDTEGILITAVNIADYKGQKNDSGYFISIAQLRRILDDELKRQQEVGEVQDVR